MLITLSYLEQNQDDGSDELISISERDTNKHKTLIRLMTQLKHQYSHQDYKMRQFAHQSALSERQLFRFFKLNLNMSPANFVQRYRLEKSLGFLCSGQSLGDISFNVGFASQSYYCRCFKQRFGKSPKNINMNSWQNINNRNEVSLLN